ncbi:MAG: 3-hydroxyacyl-CoA dehydrogenase family protein [Nitrospinota bacterium]
MRREIKKIGVIGAGTMGRGIAQVFALYDYPVVLVDKEETILQEALNKIKTHTDPELWDKVSGYIETSTNFEKTKDCDLVIEAVFENMDVKKEIYNALNKVCKNDTIIATNTSGFSINKLAEAVEKPSCFIGMHFMNPPKVMKLIEVIKGEKTSKETLKIITDLSKSIEKTPAVVNDSPGFVSNRLLFALIGEALRLLEKGVSDKGDIDTVMKYGMNHPMGPIELADFIGLDICLDIMTYLYESLEDERYKPTPMLESLVKEGKLGKKTGEGFYKY